MPAQFFFKVQALTKEMFMKRRAEIFSNLKEAQYLCLSDYIIMTLPVNFISHIIWYIIYVPDIVLLMYVPYISNLTLSDPNNT